MIRTLSLGDLRIKSASVELVESVGGGERGATLCRVRQQDLSDYGNRAQQARFMPADVIRDLEANAPRPLVTEALATEAGYTMFKLPAVAVTSGDWHALLAGMAKDGGDVMALVATHAAAMTGKQIRETNLIGEIDELISVMVTMRGVAVMVIETEG